MALGILQGYVDVANCNNVSGWVWDNENPAQSRVVTLMSGNQVLSQITANDFRQDVKDNIPQVSGNTGYYGYNFTIPSLLNDGNSHPISVVDSATGVALGPSAGSGVSFTHMCGTPNNNQVSNTDTNTTSVVSGGSGYDISTPIMGVPVWGWGVGALGLLMLLGMRKR